MEKKFLSFARVSPSRSTLRESRITSVVDRAKRNLEDWRSYFFSRTVQNGQIHCVVELCSRHGYPTLLQMGLRVTGKIELSGTSLLNGVTRNGNNGFSSSVDSMTTQCTANVSVTTDSDMVSFHGLAYHDSNISTAGLDTLSIGYWWWARASFLRSYLDCVLVEGDISAE